MPHRIYLCGIKSFSSNQPGWLCWLSSPNPVSHPKCCTLYWIGLRAWITMDLILALYIMLRSPGLQRSLCVPCQSFICLPWTKLKKESFANSHPEFKAVGPHLKMLKHCSRLPQAGADMSVTEEALICARTRTNPNEQSLLIIAIKTINYRTQTQTISAYSIPP